MMSQPLAAMLEVQMHTFLTLHFLNTQHGGGNTAKKMQLISEHIF